MKDLLPNIQESICKFESDIINNKNPISELRKCHNITLQTENDIYGFINVIMIDDNQFIAMHDSNKLAVHGFIEDYFIKVERTSNSITNYALFLYVEELFDYDPGTLVIDYSYNSGKMWKNADKIYDWFSKNFALEIEYEISYYEYMNCFEEFKKDSI